MKTLLITSMIFVAFTTDNPYVILDGQKYYKYHEVNSFRTDTLFYPGGFNIIKSQIKTVYYDHFKK